MTRWPARHPAVVAGALALALMGSACSVGAGAQGGGDGGAYPDGTIEVVVTYDAGGASDQLARIVTASMKEDLGQTFVVQNEAGGAGTVGMTSVVRAEADGYRLGFIAGGPLTVQPHYGRTTYGHDDVRAVARVATAPLLLAVRADAPWDTIEALVADLKANPGEFTYGSTGAGNPGNIAMEKLDQAAGVETKQVPFESSSEVASSLLGGNVDAGVSLPSSFAASVESGDLRILAVLGDVKASFYEDVPSLQDVGYDAVTNVINGIVAPAGTPDDVVATLSDSVETALSDPEVVSQIEASGFIPDHGTGEEYQADLEAEYQETGTVLEQLGLLDD